MSKNTTGFLPANGPELQPVIYIFMFFICVAVIFGWKGVLIVIGIPVILFVIISVLGAAES